MSTKHKHKNEMSERINDGEGVEDEEVSNLQRQIEQVLSHTTQLWPSENPEQDALFRIANLRTSLLLPALRLPWIRAQAGDELVRTQREERGRVEGREEKSAC